jgi:signal transduction histidine kinase
MLYKYINIAFLGPLSGLGFSAALYWVCWKKNFFKLRESLNLLSLIILTILITTGFVIPIGQQPIVRVIIIALCIGMIYDVWRKDGRLKYNYRQAKREVTELRMAQQNASAYLMNLAHRLKSPFSAISHLLVGIKARSARAQTDVNRARAIALNSNQTMKSLLLSGKIDAQTATVNRTSFNLSNQIKEWMSEWQALCPEHHLTLNQPKADLFITADVNALKEALTNLIDNARKYSPTGSRIAIALKPVDRQIDISVTDQGQGLPTAAQKKIFDRHY